MRSSVVWIPENVVLAAHDEQLAEHGGAEGIRDQGLLESALMRPRNAYAYSDTADIFELAALYAIGVVRNHPFLDGNKRTGLVLLELFLELNGYELAASDAATYEAIYALAAGTIGEGPFFEWVRANCRERPPLQPGGPLAGSN